ncbi:MAG TPA: response regulator transcription factor [Blastocatellia bacterium]|nr:response regulator transcription factor [Blastocatellia bacterium]
MTNHGPTLSEPTNETSGAESEKLLIVEDDPALQRMIGDYFRHTGYQVITAGDGESGARMALELRPTLVILDLMLPRLDGLSVCRRIRERNAMLPIIMLTARDDLVDKVLGLELGADDYLTKPFSLRELEARIKSLLRRTRAVSANSSDPEQAPIVRGPLRIDPTRREVTIDGRLVELTPKEFELLLLFAANPGRVFSRKYLLEKIWDYAYSGYDRTIDSHINRLRAKIEESPDQPQLVMTVWGVGYKFNDEY